MTTPSIDTPNTPGTPGGDTIRPREVKCPACRGRAVYSAANPFRPFCSARCQGLDFGAWASEAYRVEAKPTTEDLDDRDGT